VLSKLGIDQFDAADIRALEVVASHAAVALENARLLRMEREAADRARASEARKAAIVESALDCIIVVDHQGKVVEFNPAAQRTFGYTRDEAVGAEMATLIIPPAQREQHRRGLQRYLATGEGSILGRRMEATAMRADGVEFPVEVAISRVDLPGPPLFTGYLKDITARKRAESEAAAALEAERVVAQQLRELDEMKNTFLQAVSHDLRTPLAAVFGLALTLERSGADLSPEDRSDLTTRLAASARRLDRILSNLLDLERLVRGVVTPRYETVDIGAIAVRVVAEAEFLANRDVHVQTSPILADVDPVKVERILENLLANAVKHTSAESPVWLRVEEEGDCVLLVVEDAGEGVPADLRERIFEPFLRGANRESSPGSGIGLSVVSRFAELHGGSAWVEGREGGGASFRVLLPRSRAQDQIAPSAGRPPHAGLALVPE
jgi:PAS domain S-box-containing protein